MQYKDTNFYKSTYPDPFVNHPNIQHWNMTSKIFPFVDRQLIPMHLNEYLDYYKATYIALCKDFNAYEEYLIEEHFKNNLKKK